MYINARFLTQKVTGVQRYALEISKVILEEHSGVTLLTPQGQKSSYLPYKVVGSKQGYAWEQIDLPANSKTSLLWSPCNLGPVIQKDHVITIHDLFAIENPEWVSRKFHIIYSSLLPLLARKAKKILTVSNFTKERLIYKLGVKENKIDVIPCGISSIFVPQNLESVKGVLLKYGITEPFVMTLGSLEPRKNIISVIDAWKSIKGDKPLLVIAGGVGNQAIFRQQNLIGDDEDRIIFTGYVPDEDLPKLYSSTSLFIYVALAEGFGIPPLEAAACGASVLISTIPPLKEYNVYGAIEVDPFNLKELAFYIEKSESKNIGGTSKLKSNLQDVFSWRNSAKMVYSSLSGCM